METSAHEPPDAAARLLQRHDELRSRVERLGPSRGYEWLLVSSGLLLSVYIGIFLFVARSPESGGYSNLMLLPVLLFSALVSGARERFSVRTKPPFRHALAYGVVIAAFMTLGVLALMGVDYPWWLNVLVPAAWFTTMATSPVRRLWITRPITMHEQWRNLPLSVSARWTTAVIGVVLGALTAFSTSPWLPTVTATTMLVTLFTALVSWRTPWGLPRTGFRWGPAHWLTFAASTAIIFTLVVLLVTSDVITSPVAIGTGLLVSGFMVTGAVLPLRTDRR